MLNPDLYQQVLRTVLSGGKPREGLKQQLAGLQQAVGSMTGLAGQPPFAQGTPPFCRPLPPHLLQFCPTPSALVAPTPPAPHPQLPDLMSANLAAAGLQWGCGPEGPTGQLTPLLPQMTPNYMPNLMQNQWALNTQLMQSREALSSANESSSQTDCKPSGCSLCTSNPFSVLPSASLSGLSQQMQLKNPGNAAGSTREEYGFQVAAQVLAQMGLHLNLGAPHSNGSTTPEQALNGYQQMNSAAAEPTFAAVGPFRSECSSAQSQQGSHRPLKSGHSLFNEQVRNSIRAPSSETPLPAKKAKIFRPFEDSD